MPLITVAFALGKLLYSKNVLFLVKTNDFAVMESNNEVMKFLFFIKSEFQFKFFASLTQNRIIFKKPFNPKRVEKENKEERDGTRAMFIVICPGQFI